MAPAEVNVTDPQQRLLLETSFECLHAAHYRKVTLFGSNVATIVGIERPDWLALRQLLSIGAGVYGMSADNTSVASGRLPFVLGLHGPTASVDTACASGQVAAHVAASAVQH